MQIKPGDIITVGIEAGHKIKLRYKLLTTAIFRIYEAKRRKPMNLKRNDYILY